MSEEKKEGLNIELTEEVAEELIAIWLLSIILHQSLWLILSK